MESTLFTTLTVTEEASLSGGTHPKKHKPAKPPTPPTPPAKPFVLNQLALNIAVGVAAGSKIDQLALNIAEGAPGGSTVNQTALNVFTGTK